jgi:methylmalonyl-CoA mutase cobalamin-binding subunit
MMLTAGLAACLGFAALAGHGGGSDTASAVERNQAGGSQIALSAQTEHGRADADKAISRAMAARDAVAPAPKKQETPAQAAAPAAAPVEVAPVAGLSQTQMTNAKRIVEQAKRMGLNERAQTIAIATALQESNLHNLASTVYAESYEYTDEGEGSDHDSVGLFQQRPQSGWGTVKNLMKPEYAAEQFLKALVQVPGWEDMPLTYAAQAVQVSAFPEAYAKHETRATEIVSAFR